MLLKMMEPGGDLDEALHDDTFVADEPVPDLLLEFMRTQVVAAGERNASP